MNSAVTEIMDNITCPCSDRPEFLHPIGMDGTYFYFHCSGCGKLMKVTIPV